MREKKHQKLKFFQERLRERNIIFCVWENYVENEVENCKFIVRGGELEKPKIKEDKGIQEK